MILFLGSNYSGIFKKNKPTVHSFVHNLLKLNLEIFWLVYLF